MIHRMFLISSGLKETEDQRRKYFFEKNPNKYIHFFLTLTTKLIEKANMKAF